MKLTNDININVKKLREELNLGKSFDVIERIIEKQDDGVITGSGDMIYINHESEQDVDNFLTLFFI